MPIPGSEIECLYPSSGCPIPHCPGCGYEANLDGNAAASIAERFSAQELNWLSFRDVETTLAIRCMCRLPEARSASAGIELHILWDGPGGKAAAQPLPLAVNQPGRSPMS